MPNVTQSFYIEVQDSELLLLRSAISKKLHAINDSIAATKDHNLRNLYRGHFAQLNALNTKLSDAFTDPAARS